MTYLVGGAFILVFVLTFGWAAVTSAYHGLQDGDVGLVLSAGFMSLFWFWGPLWVFFQEPGLLFGGVLTLTAVGSLVMRADDEERN